ncbi:uncharacterized protein [Macrobrachium rosenbergii]|uniref:uncharacterized protein n=1 Tax=Macrobrachium rosenbergii TaxID=79674 RepID=UPI0034D76EE9
MHRLVIIISLFAVSLFAVVLAAPDISAARMAELQSIFENRKYVEDIINCIVGRSKCNAEQQQIKDVAMATVRNFGRCPDSLCTDQDREEIEESMELLQARHPDLWTRLVASMFGIDLQLGK